MLDILRPSKLSREEQRHLLDLARHAIVAKLNESPPKRVASLTPRLERKCGVFVTLKIGKNLRGCIGVVQGVKPLHLAVQEAAEAAAFQDPRFSPLKHKDLSKIRIEISVLSPLQTISSIKKIKVGKDGLLIKVGEAQGLLLPQVAKRNRWSRETFLEHACMKAGLQKDAWKQPGAQLLTFRAQVFQDETEQPNPVL